MQHKKKAWPEFFQEILDGKKNFELRLADWQCNEGDTLLLQEWDPKTEKYTGREIEKEVTSVFKTKDHEFWPKEEVEKYGFQVLGLK